MLAENLLGIGHVSTMTVGTLLSIYTKLHNFFYLGGEIMNHIIQVLPSFLIDGFL